MGGDKFSVAWCQPVGLMHIVGGRGKLITLPPSRPLASTLLAGNNMLLRTYHHPHSSLYKSCARMTGFLFILLALEVGTNRLSEMSVRNYHYSLYNNLEEYSARDNAVLISW